MKGVLSEMSIFSDTLKYYIDETAEGIVYRPVWSFRCPYQWKDSPDEQELFYIDGETGALIRDAFGW